jgi:hypothetical protein
MLKFLGASSRTYQKEQVGLAMTSWVTHRAVSSLDIDRSLFSFLQLTSGSCNQEEQIDGLV